MKLRNRMIAYTALALMGGAIAAPLPALAQNFEADVRQLSVEDLQANLQALQSGQHPLSNKDARRRLRQVQRELARRDAQQQPAQQQQQPAQQQQQQPAKQQKPAQQQPAQQQGGGNENLNREVRQYLRANQNVAGLNDRQLVDAIRTGRNLLQQQELRGRLQNEVQQTVQAAQAERQRREAAAQQPQQPPQQGGGDSDNVNREARQYLRANQNVAGLNDRQLVNAIRTGRNLLQQQDLRGNLQNQVQQTVQAAQAERQRREAAAQQPQQPPQQGGGDSDNVNREARQYLRANQNVAGLNDRQLVDAIRTGRNLLQQQELRGSLQNQVQQTVQAAQAERQRREAAAQQPQQPPQQGGGDSDNVNREARQYLRANQNVAGLNDRQLVDAIRTGRNLLQQQELRGSLQNQVQQTVQAAQAERQRRQNASQQPPAGGNADAAARRLLNDNRPASALRDNQLRDRLQEARNVMGERSLDRRLFRQVRRMAQTDAEELRNRIAQRQQDRGERREDQLDARQLLNDPRPAARLNDRQLQARITSARDLLTSGNLRPGQQARIRDMLAEARREKNRRLIAERQRRREELARQRRQNEVIIRIPRGTYEERGDIAAAEADDDLLERQLVAPPTRRIDRRYSRSEFRRNPGLRDYMPAIEVDTIRFGFNEAFVREEEIPQLERIGEIIERIVASNPDEVFLIEGHTDAVGSDSYNQALSEKRADAVREAMLQYFNIAPQNIETIGYGEDFLKIETGEAEQENRRVTIRRITPLLTGAR